MFRSFRSLAPSRNTQVTDASHGMGSGGRADEPAYTTAFWFAYGANLAMMIAMSLMFRYADFVAFIGGTELHLGWIVGLGMVGSLLMRLAQGVGIDRFGARQIWQISNLGFVLALLGHLWVEQINGPGIFMLRVLYNTSIAGIFGASITYVSRMAPPARLAEVVGTLGTSGFLGMMIGTLLGDWLHAGDTPNRETLDNMFLVAAGLGMLAMVLASFASEGEQRPGRRKSPPMRQLLRRYHAGPLLVMGVVMGFGIGLPQVFLRPFTATLGLHNIALFFWIYAPSAFISRMFMRRLPDRLGVRPTALLGGVLMVVAMLLFMLVRQQWQLALPAIVLGTAHALLFPSIVAGGSTSFPFRYRGLGTTLMLATFDLGVLIGGPTTGLLLEAAERLDLPRYPATFAAVAVLMGTAVSYYAWASRHTGTPRRVADRRRQAASEFHRAAVASQLSGQRLRGRSREDAPVHKTPA